MPSNIALDPVSGRPYFQAGADQVTLVDMPTGLLAIPGSTSVPVDHNDIYRSVDQGATWELVASGLPINATVTDPECLSAGETQYRVSAVSLLPSASTAVAVLTIDTGLSMWLNGGPGFRTVARLYYKPERTVSTGLADQEFIYLSGRKMAVVLEGDATSLVINAQAVLMPDRVDPVGGDAVSLADVLKELSHGGRILYRDPTGRRLYGALSDVQNSEPVDGVASAHFTFREAEEV